MNSTRRNFKCSQCSEIFVRRTNLVNHIKWKHIKKSRDRQLCAKCGKSFRDRFNLQRHFQKVHESQTACLLCDFRSFEKELNEHYKDNHDVEMIVQNHIFQNENDFTNWKNKLEVDTLSKYIKGPTRFNKDGSTVRYFRCHRDGYFKSKSNNLRSMKTIGSNKINAKCPSHMRVCCNDKTVSVKFVATHVGHCFDLERLTLTQHEKDEIADQISLGIPADEILDNIRSTISVDDKVRRLHLTTKRDINNIISSYRLTPNATNKSFSNNKLKIPLYSLNAEDEDKLNDNHISNIDILNNKIIEIPTYKMEELDKIKAPSQLECISKNQIKEKNVGLSDSQIEWNYIEYPNVKVEYDDSMNCLNLERRKSQFLEKMSKMLELVETEEDMESVLKHAAPLESVIRNLKHKKSLRDSTFNNANDVMRDMDCEEQISQDENETNMIDEMVDETESIAYEIIIE